MAAINRRQFILSSAALGLRAPAFALRDPSYAEQYPDMLLALLAQRLNALATKWDSVRAGIKTPEELEARNRFVREKFRAMIHGLPERTPLRPVVVRTNRREGYRVENVMFQSLPDFWVTGNLYIPDGQPPFPGVISPCGHYNDARMNPEYQSAYINLVRAGFVVLAYDPIGQGERRQYWDPRTNQTEVALAPTFEHSMPGQVLLLMGEDLTHYRVWDGMRAIDYLETRPEVDAKRIGCAGHSGGGTLTLFISALDERVQCAVVNEGGTNHRWPIDVRPESRIGPSDVEQNYFPGAIYGIDLCDLHVAIAPRPLMAMIEQYSPRFNRAADHIRARYQQFGAPEKFGTEEATDPHSWTFKLRAGATDWMSRWFLGHPGPKQEPKFQLEEASTLYCTPNGSLRYSNRGESIFTLIRKKQERLPPERKLPAERTEIADFRRQMAGEITKLIAYPDAAPGLDARLLVTTPRKGYQVEKLEFISEPGIYIPTWVFLPENVGGPQPATLFVNEAGKEADGLEFGLYEKMARKGRLVAAVDVRGIGETRPPHLPSGLRTGEFGHLFDVETAMAYMAWYMDQSLFGMRVRDVVRSVEYVLSRPDVAKNNLRVVGKGAGALWVLYAAALEPRITSVVAERGLVSYRALAQTDRYTHGAGIFIRDVLLHFDLPQVAAAIADRDLTLAAPVDAMKRGVSAPAAAEVYRWTAQVYRNAGAAEHFRIVASSEGLFL